MASLLLEATLSRGQLAGPPQVTKLVICSQVIALFLDSFDALCSIQLAVLCSLLA